MKTGWIGVNEDIKTVMLSKMSKNKEMVSNKLNVHLSQEDKGTELGSAQRLLHCSFEEAQGKEKELDKRASNLF